MDNAADADTREANAQTRALPTGGITLGEERLRLLAPQWEAISRGLRRMDELQLGEAEPVTSFVWRSEEP